VIVRQDILIIDAQSVTFRKGKKHRPKCGADKMTPWIKPCFLIRVIGQSHATENSNVEAQQEQYRIAYSTTDNMLIKKIKIY
jgi:hypothetical protein